MYWGLLHTLNLYSGILHKLQCLSCSYTIHVNGPKQFIGFLPTIFSITSKNNPIEQHIVGSQLTNDTWRGMTDKKQDSTWIW